MTTTVTMLQTRRGEDGNLWTAGSSYSASDAFATDLIVHNYATGTLPRGVMTAPAQFATDAAGNVTGLVGPGGANIILSNGYRTVVFGDSMSETEYGMIVATAAAYSSVTGLLTVTYSNHGQATGWLVRLFNRDYADLKIGRVLPVTRIDANTYTVAIPDAPGLPNGALSGSTQIRQFSWRGCEGFVTWFNMASGWRFQTLFNGAQSGDTVADALARVDDDCLAYNPEVVLMQMPGINDISAGNGPVQYADTLTAAKALIDRIVNTRARLILLNTTPVAASEAAGRGTRQKMARITRYNAEIAAYVAGKSNVIFFDAASRIVNPADADGLAQAALLRTAPDAIHYSQRGGRLIGEALWQSISSEFPTAAASLPTSVSDDYSSSAVALTSATRANGVVTATLASHGLTSGDTIKLTGGTSTVFNDWVVVTVIDSASFSFLHAGVDGACTGTIKFAQSNNLFRNCLATTATGGSVIAPITGVAASGFRLENTAGAATGVGSVVARSDGYGNSQRAVITAGAANDTLRISNNYTEYTTDLPAQVKAGRSYYAEANIKLTNVAGSNLSEIRFNIEATVDGVVYQSYSLIGYSLGPNINTDADFHARTATIVMPAGVVTIVRVSLYLRFSAAGTALTAEMGRVALRELA